MITLYGTTTSPFVRKVRIHALELGVPFTLVSTADDAGMAQLKTVTPLWKVPVAVIDGDTVMDSRIIIQEMWRRFGDRPHSLRAPGEGIPRLEEENLVTALDGILDAAINRFYLMRDGFSDTQYIARQKLRFENALEFVAGKLRGEFFTQVPRLGVSEISLICTLGWLTFREQYAVTDQPTLAAFMLAHQSRESIRNTLPG